VFPVNTSRLSLSVHEPAQRSTVETGHLITIEPVIDSARGDACYLQLIQKLSAVKARLTRTAVIAFTASNPGDGVSFVVRSLARELARATGERVLRAPATVLSEGVFTVSLRGANSASQEHGAVYTLKETSPAPKSWEARLLAENINESRRHFGWVLVDAPSLRQSELALALAPHTDGVVLVVAADGTRRAEIAWAQRSIALSSAPLLGCVLNKRTYPVPEFLYQRL
jgi:Mrp family chromosome partitioning ATPase